MKFTFIKIIALFILMVGCRQSPEPLKTVQFALWDYDWMQQVKSKLDSSETWQPALEAIITEADAALEAGAYSVTYKKMMPPGGSKHDYMSMGPYWWPDPEKPDGLPYIRRDGEINPERDELDSGPKSKMINSVRDLSLAWYFTDNQDYATKAAELLRVWFLDEKTRMNPHLEYAQAIPGITPGRFIGVIDGAAFAQLVDAIALLETSSSLSEQEVKGIRNGSESTSGGSQKAIMVKMKMPIKTTTQWLTMYRRPRLPFLQVIRNMRPEKQGNYREGGSTR
jgi:hypothetical protein